MDYLVTCTIKIIHVHGGFVFYLHANYEETDTRASGEI